MNLAGALTFAFIAAVGNGLFALGQRKAVGIENSLVFIILALMLCIFLCITIAPFFGTISYANQLKTNTLWISVSGIGLFLTYIGFNLLYKNYGASSYVLYAVLSIVTTSIIVGAYLLKEELNTYHWLAVVSATITVLLFSWGNYLKSQ